MNKTFGTILKVAATLSGVPVLEALAGLAEATTQSGMGKELPEPAAVLTVRCNAEEQRWQILRPNDVQDSWNAVVHMQPVGPIGLSKDCSVSIFVEDYDDYGENERVANVELTEEELREALKSRGDHCVDFRASTQGALVAVCLRVREHAR